jgi:hypothetical protein
MEAYYKTLFAYLDDYTIMGLFNGSRSIDDIVTLQTGTKGRVFFFDQEPMIKSIDTELWDYIFQEPTIFANSELSSKDKEYVKQRYPNFIDWYFFSHAFVSREWFSAHRHNYAGWTDNKQTVLDCNLITGSRQYRVYLIYHMFQNGFQKNSFVSFNGNHDWEKDLEDHDQFELLNEPIGFFSRIPKNKISYDSWGKENKLNNNLMQSRIPLKFYSQVNYITVSETLCVENKKHLTEKVFKPIAAGKPFILAAGYKNLEYLKSYGFKTFSDCWDESYDLIEDPKERLDQLFNTMEVDLNLGIHEQSDFGYPVDSIEYQNELQQIPIKLSKLEKAHKIAQFNREYFWSDEFYRLVLIEAMSNLGPAKEELASKNVKRNAMMSTT